MIASGSFSLIGMQDTIVYESCYKRTEHNVKPSTPVSIGVEIPEGWSATMLDVSASFPYLWESQRARTEMYSSNDISNAVLVYAGYRISNTGNKISDANYKYSDNIKLSKGQVIEVNTAGSSVSVISLSNGSTASFTPVKTLNSTVPQVSTYTADEDCNVVVCVKTTSAYSVKIYTASYGSWSTPVLKNSWGKQGAKMRMRTWSSNTEYLSGADGEEFYDVVIYLEKLYLCTKTHTSKSGTNDPVTSINGYLGFWESAQEWTFIATKLLLAEKINAEQINADGIKAKNVDIEGKITATSGILGGFTVTQSAIGSTDVGDSLLLMRNGISFNNNKKTAGIGDTLPGSTGIVSKVAGIFTTTLDKYDLHSEGIGTLIVQSKGGVSHTALSIVTEGRDNDTAIDFRGKINTHGSELGGSFGDYGLTTAVGFQHVWDPSVSRFRLGDLCFVNGILTGVRWHDN
jgi:hypothetical protein